MAESGCRVPSILDGTSPLCQLPSGYSSVPSPGTKRRRSRIGNQDENQEAQIGTLHAADRLISVPSTSSSAVVPWWYPPTPPCEISSIFRAIVVSQIGASCSSEELVKSIDDIEMAVREELMKLKETPTAKKAETERKVGTLMTMRSIFACLRQKS